MAARYSAAGNRTMEDALSPDAAPESANPPSAGSLQVSAGIEAGHAPAGINHTIATVAAARAHRLSCAAAGAALCCAGMEGLSPGTEADT